MVPDAPPIASITSGWPSAALSRGSMMRMIAMLGPPAANGMISVTGRDG